MRAKYRDEIEYGIVRFFMLLCKAMPVRMVYGAYHLFASLVFIFVKRRRNLTLKNLEIVYPDMAPKDRVALAKKAYKNISHSMAFNALLMADRISDEELLESLDIDPDEWAQLEKATDSFAKGILVITAHMGNWELLAQFAPLLINKKLHIIARKLDNELLEQKLIFPYRRRRGQRVMYKRNALLGMLKAVKKGDFAGILIDQKSSPADGGIPIPFLGRESMSIASAALLQVRFGIQAIPAFAVYTEESGRYKLIIGDPINWEDNGKPLEDQVEELARIQHKIIEDMVYKYPDQWFWMHNRWHLKKEEYR